jgi:glutaredoxin-like protein NrdH
MNIEHVTGINSGKVMLYALSTCGWCRKTRELLSNLGVAYDFVYVDLLQGKDRDDAINTVKKWNPASSFPTLVINENKCIVGFDEANIKKELKS